MTGDASVRPPASSLAASVRMKAMRRKDTGAEILLRKNLHALGLRFRIDQAPLSGVRRRADVVFRSAKVAVFVDGCFWHSCPVHATRPMANREWWARKLEQNRQRDMDTSQLLDDAGWHVIRVWEHEDMQGAAARIRRVVLARRSLFDTYRPFVES